MGGELCGEGRKEGGEKSMLKAPRWKNLVLLLKKKKKVPKK